MTQNLSSHLIHWSAVSYVVNVYKKLLEYGSKRLELLYKNVRIVFWAKMTARHQRCLVLEMRQDGFHHLCSPCGLHMTPHVACGDPVVLHSINVYHACCLMNGWRWIAFNAACSTSRAVALFLGHFALSVARHAEIAKQELCSMYICI